MANEFVAKNGLISQNNSTVTGSLTVTNGITGSLYGTASNVEGGVDSYIAKWNGSSQLTPSIVYEDGSGIGIGTTTILQKLTVDGGGYFSLGVSIDDNLQNGYNTAIYGSDSHAEGSNTSIGQLWIFGTFTSGLVEISSDPPYDSSGDFGKYLNIEGTLYEIASTTYTIPEPSLFGSLQIQLVDTSVNGTYYYTSTITITPYSATYNFSPPQASHAEGRATITNGNYSHAEGMNTLALSPASHAEGLGTIAYGYYQHVEGAYNIPLTNPSAFILGNGTSDLNRSNLIYASGSQVQITGSLLVSGSSTFTNIGPAVFSGSVTSTAGFTGSFSGTATTASYALQAVSSSFASTASFVTTAQTASFVVTAQTASFVTASNIRGVVTAAKNITEYTLNQDVRTDSQVLFGGVTGSLFGTASWATQAITASFVTTAQTASFVTASNVRGVITSASLAQTASFVTASNVIGTVTSASYAVTASYALNAGAGSGFPFSGSAVITGSLLVSGSGVVITGSLNVTGSTNLTNTIGNTVLVSNADTLIITGSLIVSGSTIMTGSLNVSAGITGSLFGTAQTASFVTASNIVGTVTSASYALTASFTTTAQTSNTASLASTASNIQGGTGNYIPLWTGSTRLGSSVLYQNGTSIGLGTISPNTILHISGASAQPLVNIENNTPTGYTNMRFTGTGKKFIIGVGNASETTFSIANDFFIYDDSVGAVRMVVDTNGKVGIGTTSPSTTLEINGDVKASSFTGSLQGTSSYTTDFDDYDYFLVTSFRTLYNY